MTITEALERMDQAQPIYTPSGREGKIFRITKDSRESALAIVLFTDGGVAEVLVDSLR